MLEKRLFLGSIDDSVSRYPWTDVEVSLGALNRTLIYYGLLGPSLCCRVGNILYNPTYFESMIKPESSPLISLAQAGFVQFQMKQDSLNESIEARKEIGTNTALNFIKHHSWSKGSSIYNKLNEIDELLKNNKGKIKYNSKFHTHFQDIVDQISNARSDMAIPEAYWKTFDEWDKRHPRDSMRRTRSNFEEISKTIHNTDNLSLHLAMSVINSANHYAYGIALNEKFEGTSFETNELRSLQHLTKTFTGQEERFLDLERYDEIVRSRILDAVEKNLSVPDRLMNDPTAWADFARLLDKDQTGSDYHDFHALKSRLLEDILAIDTSNNLTLSRKNIEKSAKEYSKYLHKKFPNPTGKSDFVRYKLALSAAAEKYVGGEAESKIAAGVGAIAAEAESLIIPGATFTLSLIAQYGIGKAMNKFINRDIGQGRLVHDESPEVNRILEVSRPIRGALCVRQVDTQSI